jgi:hypothetical protein
MYKTAIEIPTNWTAEHDQQYFEEILGDATDAHKLFLKHWTWSICKRDDVLDSAIEFFLDSTDLDPILDGLAERSKVEVLRRLSNRADILDCVRQRILRDLAYFDKVRAATEPIFERFTIERKKVWLRELVDAYDLTVCAWSLLDETLQCQFPTYRQRCAQSGVDAELRPASVSSQANRLPASPRQQGDAQTGESSFRVVANCNLYAVSEFSVLAESAEDAEAKAEEMLGELGFLASACLPGGEAWPLRLGNECVETEIVEIKNEK